MQVSNSRAEVPIPKLVWGHFSDLQHIRALGRTAGKEIVVIGLTGLLFLMAAFVAYGRWFLVP